MNMKAKPCPQCGDNTGNLMLNESRLWCAICSWSIKLEPIHEKVILAIWKDGIKKCLNTQQWCRQDELSAENCPE